MQNKREYIQNLKKVKLVIGNGFDLQCGMQTKYCHFFESNEEKNEHIRTWIEKINSNLIMFLDFTRSKDNDIWNNFNFKTVINVWDFFFYLVSFEKSDLLKNMNWCDIEEVMLEWFEDPKKDIVSKKKYCNWSYVYKILKGERLLYSLDSFYILAIIINKLNDYKKFSNEIEFYNFLLKQLKKFESNFGNYILDESNRIMVEGNYSFISVYEKSMPATQLIKKLCNINSLVSVDSFNYDFIGIEGLKPIFHNINGNISYPIFGIDSSAFLPSDPRYIFCKTNRRMELDMLEYEAYEREEFENVIIYGHSLTVSDYSYFFSLLDKLDIVNFTKKSVIVFAYSVYDKEKEEKIKSDYRLAISNLFKEYSKYKGNSEYPNRLLDALTTQGKVLLYEI